MGDARPSRYRYGLFAFLLSVALSVPAAAEPVPAARAGGAPAVAVAPSMLPSGPGTDPAEGTAKPPALGAAGVQRRIAEMEQLSAAATSRPLPTTYDKAAFVPRPLTGTALPYNLSTVYDPPVDRDATGVRMYRLPANGRLYNHPVAQAQDALTSLSNYRLTGNASYLNRAMRDAQRIIDRRVISDGAWYFPYPFDFALHGGSNVLRAPWFSAMAQGQALSVFVRLNQVTGQPRWRDAANVTFNSFRNAPAPGLPSTVNIDPANHLWLEEYPRWPPTASDRTLNGHVYAVFGLYDHLRLTGDPVAVDLWNGALANTRVRVQAGFRNPGYISHYCLRHLPVQSAGYHDIHWRQMVSLHASTRDPGWSRIADALRADYPPPAVRGTVMLVAGTHTGYRFDKNGAVTGRKSLGLSRRSGAPGDSRTRVKGRGVYLRITAGSLAGYSVAENHQRAWLAGVRLSLTYPLPRTVRIPAGSWSAYRYDVAGRVTAAKTIRPTATTSAPFSRSATVNGRLQVLVTAGTLAGYWLPAQRMTLI